MASESIRRRNDFVGVGQEQDKIGAHLALRRSVSASRHDYAWVMPSRAPPGISQSTDVYLRVSYTRHDADVDFCKSRSSIYPAETATSMLIYILHT